MKLGKFIGVTAAAAVLGLGGSLIGAIPAQAREERYLETPLSCSTSLYSYGYGTGNQAHTHTSNGANRTRTWAGDLSVPQRRLYDSGFKSVSKVYLRVDGYFWNGNYGRTCDW